MWRGGTKRQKLRAGRFRKRYSKSLELALEGNKGDYVWRIIGYNKALEVVIVSKVFDKDTPMQEIFDIEERYTKEMPHLDFCFEKYVANEQTPETKIY